MEAVDETVTVIGTLQASGEGGSLDLASEGFNPLAALYAESLCDLAGIEPLASVKEFEQYLIQPDAVLKAREKLSQRKAKALAARVAALAATQPKLELEKTATHRTKNVLTKMECFQGPLSKLHEWVKDRRRLRVTIRSFHGIRGTCVGFVVAFDKYFNLAMVDVDEIYSSLIKTKRRRLRVIPARTESNSKCEMERLIQRVNVLRLSSTRIRCRHFNQLFITGNNVVSISSVL